MMDMRTLRENSSNWSILQKRAEALAHQDTLTDVALGEEVLSFRLGDEHYSIPARFVREVQPLEAVTRLPSTPSFILGLVNVRGRLFTIIDIRPLLDIAQTPPDPDAFLMIVSAGGMEVSLLADAVLAIGQSDAELTPALSASAGHGIAWVRGIDRHLTLQLDPILLLADPRLIVNDVSN